MTCHCGESYANDCPTCTALLNRELEDESLDCEEYHQELRDFYQAQTIDWAVKRIMGE